MPETQITIAVRHVDTKVAILDIHGDISASAEKALMDAYAQVGTPKIRTVLLNFTDMGYMNSTGIGLIVTLLMRANRQKQRLVAYGLSDHYWHIFELTRLNDVIHLYPSEADALKAEQAT